MPGIKRRASQLPSAEKPPKLKKQSTSATTATAKGKVEKKKKPNQVDSLDSPPKLEKISAVNSPRKLASPGKKSPEKKYKMPRFPTLKPTKPSSDAEGFSISAPSFYSKSSPSTNFTKLKTDSTIKLDSKKPENKLNNDKETCLTSEATEILPPQLEIEVDPSFTRASEIEKKMQKLPSGSIVGKITNLEFDDLILPLEASDVIYEFSDESSSPTYGASKITSGGLQSRASAFEVAEYLTSLDKSSSENTLEEPLTKIEEEISETVDEEQVKTDKEVEENLDKPDKESSDEDSDRPVQDTVDYSDDDDSDKTEDKEESKQETKTSETASPVKTPRKVPGGLREIVFSFDTTGSMYNYMEEAGERIRDLVKRLQNEMPGIRLAFMAHGDYYDLSHDRYLIKWIDFGASIEEVVKFFDNLSITHGGDDDECYELVLRKTRESLSWTPGSQRSLVLIGDSDPHEPGYKYEQFVNDIDWRVETALLKEMGIRIYGLQVGYRSDFYKQISKITGGAHLRLDNASFTYETLMSICLREGTLKLLKSYENEVRKAKKQSEKGGILDLELERLFSSLKSVEDNKSTKTMLKEQKQALKEEKKAKKALELEAKGEKRPAESGDESSPAKKVKGEKKSPPKVPGKFKNAATAKILSKAKRTIIEKKIVKTSPVKKGTKDDSSDDQEEDSKSKVKTKGRVKQIKTSPKNSPKSVKKSVKSGSVVQNDSPKKKDSEKKKPGRPSKTQSDGGKKTGRPPKSKASDGKKKPGRPAKVLEKEKKKPKSQNDSEKKKPGRPSKSAPSASSKEKKADDKEKVKGKVMKSKTRGVQPKRSESKTSKTVQSSKSSPAAKNSPGKITKPKVSPRVNNKKATLLKKSVKDTTNSVVKKQEKTQVAKKTEKSTPVNKTKSESKTPKKAQKAEKTSPKSKASPKVSKPVKKQPRETAAVTKFVMGPLSVLSWENWLPLITHTKPDVKTEDWKRKPSVSPGFCNDKVYNGEMSQAVYEIAVSPPDSTKRYPVYYAVDALWSCFASPHVKKEVERIIKAKGSISVRKGSMGKPNDAVFQKAVDFMKLNFDYAWDGRGEDVKKDGFVIARGT